ncbi:MAG: cation diffusion facilitator family transporter [Fervidicoccaceae archaeon]|jgi:divalent metal cation (Fe/Co/Zn/Cd) transporter
MGSTDGRNLILIITTSFLGGMFKIIGGIIYSSKSVFVDALTSMANFASLVLTFVYLKKSYEPPDKDHHFGHYRLKFGGSIFTLMTYSLVGGIALLEVISPKPYKVSVGAPIMASLGLVFYLVSIIISKSSKEDPLRYYASFTVSEVIEGVTVILSSLLGVFYSYLIDYGGSVILTLYIFFELYQSFKDIIMKISDVAPPQPVLDNIKKEFEERGLRVEDIRMRYVDESRLEGHITVSGLKREEREEIEKALIEAKKDVLDKYNADVFVEFKERGKKSENG